MKAFTVWLDKPDVTVFVGGNPSKGKKPTITAKMDKVQVIVDEDKNTITIVETK